AVNSLAYQFPASIAAAGVTNEASILVGSVLNFSLPLDNGGGHVHDVVGSATRTSCVQGGSLTGLDSRAIPPKIPTRRDSSANLVKRVFGFATGDPGLTLALPDPGPTPTVTFYPYTFATPGVFYFFSSDNDDCSKGMNAAVTVTTTSPTPPPTPTPNVCSESPDEAKVCDSLTTVAMCLNHAPASVTRCPANEQCYLGSCVSNLCSGKGNSTVCGNGGPVTCHDGFISSETSCADGQMCSAGACVANPCSNVTNGMWVCESPSIRTMCLRQLPGEIVHCMEGNMCFNGICQVNVCSGTQNTTSVCLGDGVVTCVDGLITGEAACAAGQMRVCAGSGDDDIYYDDDDDDNDNDGGANDCKHDQLNDV
ncbi:hypothetical protein HK101_005315, partial [Irineochytrium annulatum]